MLSPAIAPEATDSVAIRELRFLLLEDFRQYRAEKHAGEERLKQRKTGPHPEAVDRTGNFLASLDEEGYKFPVR